MDAAVVYANNEPVQLGLQGKSINEIKTWEFAQLVGNGVATNAATIKEHPKLVRGFVRALLRGVQDTINNPAEALEISVKQYPEFGGERMASSKAVLDASIGLWKNTSSAKPVLPIGKRWSNLCAKQDSFPPRRM